MATPTLHQMNNFTRAASGGDNTAVAAFLDRFPDAINNPGVIGWPALMWAIAYGHKDTVTLLLEKGANINEKTAWGVTPLMKGAETGYKGLVELLLEKGADIEDKDASGRTVLAWAKRNPRAEVRAFLEQWSAKQCQRLLEQQARELAAEIADFSPALKRDLPAPRPLNFKKGL